MKYLSKEAKRITRNEKIANLNFETFKLLSEDLIDAYDKGYLRIVLAGPRISAYLPSDIEKMLMEKHRIDEETFRSMIMGLLFCLHYVLRNEESEVLELLKRKNEKLVKKMEEKIVFTKNLLVKHPEIEQSFYTYTSSISNIFEDLEWEVSLKFARSLPLEKSFPPFPVAKVRLTLRKAMLAPRETKSKCVEFDISLKDIDNMIKSLKELKEALISLQTKKIT